MKKLFALAIVFSCVFSAYSYTKIPLWSGKAPGAKGTTSADTPFINVFMPTVAANGAAVVVCPGGGYSYLANTYEGWDVAQWYAAKGFVGVVLFYRVTPYHHPVEMWDAQRAIRFVRYKAKEWNVDTGKVGIVGFSAGGHLASTAATHFTSGKPDTADTIERFGSRPNFGIFVYPVITMDSSFTHWGSRINLLGTNPSQALVDSLSNEKQVTRATPPCYLAQGIIDKVVPVKNSQVYYDSCVAKKVTAKFYEILLSCGNHGFGLNCGNWPDSSYNWLHTIGILPGASSIIKPSQSPARSFAMGKGMAVYDISGRKYNFIVGNSQNNKKTFDDVSKSLPPGMFLLSRPGSPVD